MVKNYHQHFRSFGLLSLMECLESFDSFHLPACWLTNTTTASSMAPSGTVYTQLILVGTMIMLFKVKEKKRKEKVLKMHLEEHPSRNEAVGSCDLKKIIES